MAAVCVTCFLADADYEDCSHCDNCACCEKKSED